MKTAKRLATRSVSASSSVRIGSRYRGKTILNFTSIGQNVPGFGFGGETVDEKVYDEINYIEPLLQDMEETQFSFKFMSSFAAMPAIERLLEPLRNMVERKATVCIFLQKPIGWDKRELLPPEDMRFKRLEHCSAMLRETGAHVNMRNGDHKKVIVIDWYRVWRGSMNGLSVNPNMTKEEMVRIEDSFKAMGAIERHHLNDCDECIALQRAEIDSIRLDVQNPGKQISKWRNAREISVRKLAPQAKVHRTTLENIERGGRIPRIDTFADICDALGKELVALPLEVVPVFETILKRMPSTRPNLNALNQPRIGNTKSSKKNRKLDLNSKTDADTSSDAKTKSDANTKSDASAELSIFEVR